eukprot:Gb_27782 [translate_table: standard]
MGRRGMTTPRTCSALEHCFKSWSINHGSSSPSPTPKESSIHPITKDEATQKSSLKGLLELNSEPALPYQWEQFLDLKTGELYYIDWSVGKKAKIDPREVLRVSEDRLKSRFEELAALLSASVKEKLAHKPKIAHQGISTPLYSLEADDDISEIESMDEDSDDSEQTHLTFESDEKGSNDTNILVAAGCRSCLMYFMLPKVVLECPKCGTVLLHFNQPAAQSSSEEKGTLEIFKVEVGFQKQINAAGNLILVLGREDKTEYMTQILERMFRVQLLMWMCNQAIIYPTAYTIIMRQGSGICTRLSWDAFFIHLFIR